MSNRVFASALVATIITATTSAVRQTEHRRLKMYPDRWTAVVVTAVVSTTIERIVVATIGAPIARIVVATIVSAPRIVIAPTDVNAKSRPVVTPIVPPAPTSPPSACVAHFLH